MGRLKLDAERLAEYTIEKTSDGRFTLSLSYIIINEEELDAILDKLQPPKSSPYELGVVRVAKIEKLDIV